MKVLVLDGRTVDCELAKGIENSLKRQLSNHEMEWIRLKDKKIDPCLGCFGCWIRTPGICVINDEANKITELMARCDLQIEITPVTFGGFSSELKKMLDRSIPNLLPFFRNFKGETHHYQRYEILPSNLTIGYQDRLEPESKSVFENLATRNALNMNPPRSSLLVLDRQSDIDEMISESLREVLA